MGAFKFRGACNTISQLPAEARARGVVAYSSGNHAQAVALVAKELGIPAVIVMPSTAPGAKLEATRGYGAELVHYDQVGERARSAGGAVGARARPDADSAVQSSRHRRRRRDRRGRIVRGGRRSRCAAGTARWRRTAVGLGARGARALPVVRGDRRRARRGRRRRPLLPQREAGARGRSADHRRWRAHADARTDHTGVDPSLRPRRDHGRRRRADRGDALRHGSA